MATNDAVMVVQQAFQKFAGGDIPGFMAMLAVDVDWHEPGPNDVLPWVGTYKGHEGVVRWMTQLGGAVADLQIMPDEMFPAGDRVVVLGRETGTIIATGDPYISDFVFIFRVANGKIASYRSYHDTAAQVDAATA